MENLLINNKNNPKDVQNSLKYLNEKLNRNKSDLNTINLKINDTTKKLLELHPQLEEAEDNYNNLKSQMEDAENNLTYNNLKSQMEDTENNLTSLQPELDDEILNLKFKIKKLKKEKIPLAYDELETLSKKEEVLRSEIHDLQDKRTAIEKEVDTTEKIIIKIQQDEEYRKDRLYKKLYVEYDDDVLSKLFTHFNLQESSDDENLKLLVDKYSEDVIYHFIDPEKYQLELQKNREELLNTFNLSETEYKIFISEHVDELCEIFPVSKYSSNVVERLMNNYDSV